MEDTAAEARGGYNITVSIKSREAVSPLSYPSSISVRDGRDIRPLHLAKRVASPLEEKKRPTVTLLFIAS